MIRRNKSEFRIRGRRCAVGTGGRRSEKRSGGISAWRAQLDLDLEYNRPSRTCWGAGFIFSGGVETRAY